MEVIDVAIFAFEHRKRAADWEDDMQSGLRVIAARAGGLTRFMNAYARLSRLPQPVLTPTSIRALIERVARFEIRMPVEIIGGPEVSAQVDAAQIEQVLINLIISAVDAARENHGAVRVRWQQTPGTLEIEVEDDGPGIASFSDLFVPFFTTKGNGSGIGLVLCRQIAENHGGSITLANRTDGSTGCVARLRLPG